MRKIIPCLLIILYSIQIFGVAVFYFYQKKQIRHEFNLFLKNNLTIDDLVLIKKPKDNSLNQYFTHIEEDEFSFMGSMYDIVKQTENNDTIFYYCFNDKKEDILHKNLLDHFNNTLSGNSQSKRNLLKIVQFLTLGFLENKLKLEIHFDKIINQINIINIPVSFEPDTISPPPRILA